MVLSAERGKMTPEEGVIFNFITKLSGREKIGERAPTPSGLFPLHSISG
jgi:hypothetical protein